MSTSIDPDFEAMQRLQEKHAEREVRAAAIKAELTKAEEPALSVAAIVPAFAQLLAGLKPSAPDDYRAHALATEVLPALERWGFEKRFLYEVPDMHPRQRRAYDDLCERMTGRGAVVALVGERGLGKTTIAAQFAVATAWKNYHEARKTEGAPDISHVIYKKCTKLIARFKSLYADFGSTDTNTLLDSLDYLCRQQEFLVIDEIHDCEEMKFKPRLLTDLIDRRYSACRDTILIANQSAEDFAVTIGDSILSRLNEHGAIITCLWPSYRVQ